MRYQYKKAKAPTELSVSQGFGTETWDFDSQKISVPCQAECPAMTDVPGYIEKISQGKYNEAYEINLEDNVMPGVLGRICARPCQKKCRHNWTDINGPVEICRLKRYAADKAAKPIKLPAPWFSKTGFKIAVIGGGPAGLAAARELIRFGHKVTVFEKENHLGGMLIDGIPRFRLPLSIVEEEIDQIISSGVDVKTGFYVGKSELENIINEYNAVLVCTGTTHPNIINIPGLKDNQYLSGLEFMKQYNNEGIKKLTGDVIIIGGGFTAVDSARACARTARKLLGNNGNVTIVYRRTEEFLAADSDEREEIEKENIKILTLLSPISVNTKNGRLQSVIFQKNYIKKSLHSEKGDILPIEGSDVELKCNHLIMAIGQKQDYSILPDGISIAEKFKTTRENLFIAGDFLNGSLNVIQSIADGKEAARLIDKYLTKEDRLQRKVLIETANENGETGRQRHHDVQFNLPVRNIDVKSRIPGNPEVEKAYSDKETQVHSTRCYLCHYKLEIDPELCIQCKWCIDVSPRNCIKMVSHFEYDDNGVILKAHMADKIEDSTFIWIDNKNCIRCGRCLRVCPTSAISMKKTKLMDCPNNL